MNKKIGIITFHRAINLGAMLQAYALERTISKKYNAMIIDYRSEKIEKLYYSPKTAQSKIKGIIKYLLSPSKERMRKKKEKNFLDFYNRYIHTTENSYSESNIRDVNELFDAVVTGSDQVWNPKITGNDLHYFLDFIDSIKRFSYAASFGNTLDIFESDKIESIINLLGTFRRPLLREKSGFEVLEKIHTDSAHNAKQVCDPIFLLSRDEWVSNLHLNYNDEEYILLFIVAPETNALRFARTIANKNNYKIKYINSYGRIDECPEDCENCMDAGPKEFLELILNAKCIITTSFHGMAFALNFNKEFYFELDEREFARNDRLIDLANVFSVGDRQICSSNQEISSRVIDYEMINKVLKEYSSESREILFRTLEEGLYGTF